MSPRFPVFLDLAARRVVLVGGGRTAAAKLPPLVDAGADVRVVAPDVVPAIVEAGVPVARRRFAPSDLDGAWLAVAAATPVVNRQVSEAAGVRRIFVNAVDDPLNASAFLAGVVRRDRVAIAISTDGTAPALAGLLREAIDDVLPCDLDRWVAEARRLRIGWKARRTPMEARRGLLLDALNALYDGRSGRERLRPASEASRAAARGGGAPRALIQAGREGREGGDLPGCPWLHGPEDTWL